MKKTLLRLLLIVLIFSCAEKEDEEIYQGKLEELIVGEISLIKDSLTSVIDIKQILVIDDVEYPVSGDKQNVKIYSLETGRVIHDFQLPLIGPYAFDDYVALFYADSKNEIAVLNTQGMFYEYEEGVLLKRILINSEIPYLTTLGSALYKLKKGRYRTVISPLSFFTTKDNSAYDKSLEKWVLDFDSNNKQIDFYGIDFPFGYLKKFATDIRSYPPDLLYLDFEGLSYYTFPYSDSVFIYKDSLLVSKSIFEPARKPNYGGSEFVIKTSVTNDRIGLYELKKESSATIDLLFDKTRDLFLLLRKLNESGTGETNDSRTKNYSLSFYNRDFDSLGEFDFSYPPNSDLKNWFITSEGLFINKPEQESEDEYGFYKIDLSGFANE
ncbi:DUF4221 domain-containing protein [Algoriphagus sp. AGSA1]|uniref:DUF4221 domain-containing protein n=1 Tax=Algoriphagus sp. AGSA1 TaxID=2907213 RepID=UPI001F1A883C|nr:DUF4221 domain-containing protein [Algoriphagus sp. AGSA1]MCE7055776.1 DUF4221 domain-containing protein [Algoriphagus sp. AGSA1]